MSKFAPFIPLFPATSNPVSPRHLHFAMSVSHSCSLRLNISITALPSELTLETKSVKSENKNGIPWVRKVKTCGLVRPNDVVTLPFASSCSDTPRRFIGG